MKIKAEQKNSRQSPRKVRLVANQVQHLPLVQAFAQLALIERKASLVLLKVMRQAVANATHNHQLSIDDLEIDKILVKTGSTYKRWQPVSRGRAHKILKRTAHVEVTLKTKAVQKAITSAQSEQKQVETKATEQLKTAKQAKQVKIKKPITKDNLAKQSVKAAAKISSKIPAQSLAKNTKVTTRRINQPSSGK
jgi:large subunit ribosomal protein L22